MLIFTHRPLLLGTCVALGLMALSAHAEETPLQTLPETLTYAYEHHPALQAARARLRATDTMLPEAQSGWRPTADLSLDGGIGRFSADDARTSTNYPRSVTLSLRQPIWQGGRTESAIRQARAEIAADRSRLLTTEQQVLLRAASAYFDLQRDLEILALERDNHTQLGQQLTGASHRFDAGELTVTDVRQAEARLAGATAAVAAAEGNVEIGRQVFLRATGRPAGQLAPAAVAMDPPANSDEVTAAAATGDPQVSTSQSTQEAAIANIDYTRSALRPEVALQLGLTRSWNSGTAFDSGSNYDDARVVGSIIVPLYHSGIDYARLAGARETATARGLELADEQAASREQALVAWRNLLTARTSLAARAAQALATAAALQGVQTENQVGTRSVLDVLDAQQERREARIAQAQTECDVELAKLQLLAAMGQLTAQNLQLPVQVYNPDAHLDKVDGNWFGDN